MGSVHNMGIIKITHKHFIVAYYLLICVWGVGCGGCSPLLIWRIELSSLAFNSVAIEPTVIYCGRTH